jgi:DNA-binding NarL/FixJ family response regulator
VNRPAVHRSQPQLRVLIVDDHALVREGLRDLIQRSPDLAVCGVAGSGTEALGAVARLDPDLVVLDLSLGDSDGTQLIREIAARSQRVRVLVLSTYEESVYAERCLRAGARGYLNKRAAVQDIRRAIRIVAEGGVFLSDAALARRAGAPAPVRDSLHAEAGPEVLSDRELEVFQLLGRGHGPTQIADSMGLSIKTIEGYMARIKAKLDLETADGLHQFAVSWYRGAGR